MERLKSALANVIVQYIMKVAGIWLSTYGISQGSVMEIVTGLIVLLFGVFGQLIQVNTAKNQGPPPEPLKPSLNK